MEKRKTLVLRWSEKCSNREIVIIIIQIKIWAVKNIFPLDFSKYINYSEEQKNMKFVNV